MKLNDILLACELVLYRNIVAVILENTLFSPLTLQGSIPTLRKLILLISSGGFHISVTVRVSMLELYISPKLHPSSRMELCTYARPKTQHIPIQTSTLQLQEKSIPAKKDDMVSTDPSHVTRRDNRNTAISIKQRENISAIQQHKGVKVNPQCILSSTLVLNCPHISGEST